MKRNLITALVAIVAVGGVFVSQASGTSKKAFVTYYEAPTCNNIDCSTRPTGELCSGLTLFSDPDCQIPVSNVSGRKLDIQ